MLLGGTYAALPFLIARIAPALAPRLGLSTIHIDIGYPKLRGVEIRKLTLLGDGFAIDGEGAEIGYTLSELIEGRVASLAFEVLTLSVSADQSGSNRQFETQDQLIPQFPFRQLSAERLVLELPDIGFLGKGGAVLTEGVLSLALKGVEPAQAANFTMTASFSYNGVFNASFGESGSTAQEFLIVQGEIREHALVLSGNFHLVDYAWSVASALAQLPLGDGAVAGTFGAQLPWPLPDTVTLDDVQLTLPTVSLNWSNADLSVRGINGSAGFTDGKLAANIGGQAVAGVGSARVEVALPPNYAIDYDLAKRTLQGGAGLRATVTDGNAAMTAAVSSFVIRDADPPETKLDANVVGSVGTLKATGALKGHAGFEGSTIAGSFDFRGSVNLDSQRRPADIRADYRLTPEKLSSIGTLSSEIVVDAPFEITFDRATTSGEIEVTGQLDIQEPLAASLFADWAEPYDLDAGRLTWDLRLHWATPALVRGQLSADLADANGFFEVYLARGISGNLVFSNDSFFESASWRLLPTLLNVQRVDVGMPIDALAVELAWQDDTVNIASTRAELLGGRVSTGPFTYVISDGAATFDLAVEAISLSEVLALEGDDVTATGTLNGVLPIVVANNEVTVTAGQLSAPGPGSIKISSALASLSGQPGLDFALAALQDFKYSELTAGIDYFPNGDLALGVGLKGHNPAVEGGRPIHYNLNINENIPVLLESLRFQDEVAGQVEKRVIR